MEVYIRYILMGITKSECTQLLYNQFMPDFSQIDNVGLVV
jgi:hypothetical protein